MVEPTSTGFDQPLRFSIPARDARGRAVRLSQVLNTVLSAHAYPPVIERILAEALVLGALLGTLLKDSAGQVTLQAQTEAGVIRLLAVDYKAVSETAGELRGYVQFDADRLAEQGSDPTLFALFGKGYLAITFDQPTPVTGDNERYQGIVPLEGQSLADATEKYFGQSEQIPTLLRVAVGHDADGCVAGGLLIQHLPDGEEGRERLHVQLDHPEWDHVRILAETVQAGELIDPDLSLEALIWRLFHEEAEVRIAPGAHLTRGCRCNAAHIRDVLALFPAEERAAMAGDDGLITVDCAFCSRLFPVDPGSLPAA